MILHDQEWGVKNSFLTGRSLMQGTAICRRWLGEGKGKSVILLLSYWNCSVFATVHLFPEDADKQQKKAFKLS